MDTTWATPVRSQVIHDRLVVLGHDQWIVAGMTPIETSGFSPVKVAVDECNKKYKSSEKVQNYNFGAHVARFWH